MSFFAKNNAENDYFDQRLECALPKRWSKYTTPKVVLKTVPTLGKNSIKKLVKTLNVFNVSRCLFVWDTNLK